MENIRYSLLQLSPSDDRSCWKRWGRKVRTPPILFTSARVNTKLSVPTFRRDNSDTHRGRSARFWCLASARTKSAAIAANGRHSSGFAGMNGILRRSHICMRSRSSDRNSDILSEKGASEVSQRPYCQPDAKASAARVKRVR